MLRSGILEDFDTSSPWLYPRILYGFANADVPGEKPWEIRAGIAPRQETGTMDCGPLVVAVAQHLLQGTKIDMRLGGKKKMAQLRSNLAESLKDELMVGVGYEDTAPVQATVPMVETVAPPKEKDAAPKEKPFRIPKLKVVKKRRVQSSDPCSSSAAPGMASHQTLTVRQDLSGPSICRPPASDQVIHTVPVCELQEQVERIRGVRNRGVLCVGAVEEFVERTYVDRPRKCEDMKFVSSTWLCRAVASHYRDPLPQHLRLKESRVIVPFIEDIVWYVLNACT